MDFLDLVFSKAHCPHDFGKMLPIIYRPTDESMSCNFAVRENGNIRGIVGLFPAEMKVGDEILKVGGIGGVSAHPRDKGKGWMKSLMAAAVGEMQQNGTDFSWLGGLRHRYQYYGYETTGVMMEYDVSKTNIRHVFAGKEAESLTLVPIKKTDSEYLKKAKELHDRQPIYCVRPEEDFWLFLTAVYTVPWAALDADGKMIGYLVVSSDGKKVNEVFAEKETWIAPMIKSMLEQSAEQEVQVRLAPWQEEAARDLGRLAEEFRVAGCGNFQIFNWDRVVGSLLKVKAQRELLADGSMLIGIKDYGTLQITVQGRTAECKKTDLEAEVELDSFTAMRVFFGSCPISLTAEVPEHVKMLGKAWFPLPMCWLIQNHV
jgi:hypothetical protein